MTAVPLAGSPATISPFGPRRALERTEAFQMFGAGIGDQADAGARDLHQLFDVAATVGAHLDHRAAVAVVQAQQRHGHTEVIVEIAARGQTRPALRQDGGQHLLDRGLAVAAGHADHRTR
jgi:hypothetical protein